MINKLKQKFNNILYKSLSMCSNLKTLNFLIDRLFKKYKVKRAIFLAAGKGSRLAPLTNITPKPLILVNGTRIIDTLIDACLNIGIDEIYVVRGYMSDQFDLLLEKYPQIKFIDNPMYDTTNNIYSLLLAKDLLSNAYIFESDLLLTNNILTKYHLHSSVFGIPVLLTTDWCLFSDSEGFVINEQFGGFNCYQMVGIYYFNKTDGEQLKLDLEKEPNMNLYWETVPNIKQKGKYKIKIIPCEKQDVIEIDTLEELKLLDKTYE